MILMILGAAWLVGWWLYRRPRNDQPRFPRSKY
jgi:hypothetical protein